ncbi:MAG: tryptophan synthase subunit beta [Rhodobacterales bacterium]|nr:tryptophan synthase subunit beta [Rhodobacterales bacterium]
MTRRERRFQRQFDALERMIPGAEGVFGRLRSNRWRLLRLPLALLLIVSGVFSFLPVLGIWMLPLGLLLLAVDLPFLRGPISSFVIRGRVAARRLARRWREWRKRP